MLINLILESRKINIVSDNTKNLDLLLYILQGSTDLVYLSDYNDIANYSKKTIILKREKTNRLSYSENLFIIKKNIIDECG